MDWPAFLNNNGIEFVEHGRNVSRGNIAINCPLCGGADPSQHLNISLSGRGFYCLRNRAHSGGEARLVQALLNCSYEQARAVVQDDRSLPEDWYSRIMVLAGGAPNNSAPQHPLQWPKEFRELDQKVRARPYWNYLLGRRYTNIQIAKLWQRFDICYCTSGPFSGRIIFPIYFEDRLVTWTGRAISPRSMLRYKTLSADPEKAGEEGTQVALGPVSDYLLFWDQLLTSDADTIVLCEGPFDALRMMTLGRRRGVVATCCFTAQPSNAQIDLLHELLPRFTRRLLLLDQGTWATGMRVTDTLAALGVERLDLPLGVKDPGELDLVGFTQLLHLSTEPAILQLHSTPR